MKRLLNSVAKRYAKDTSGQFAIWTGVVLLPVLAIGTAGIDIARADSLKSSLQHALDSAALAAVTEQKLTSGQRAAYAKDYFDSNYADSDKFKMQPVHTGSDRVELYAEGTSTLSVAAFLGVKDLKVKATSVSEVTKGGTICVMTLNPHGEGSFSVTDGAKFNASTCSVQVNSDHEKAAIISRNSSASAKEFCVRGGANGSERYFTPFVNTECSFIDDPFTELPEPKLAQNCSLTEFDNKISDGKNRWFSFLKSNEVEDLTKVGDNVTLNPGRYCNPINISGKNVKLKKGTYIMDDQPINFLAGSEVDAEDVTIILNGTNSSITVEGGSSLEIKAPATGDYAGIAIYQNVTTDITGKNGKGSGILPNGKTELMGGSSMNIIGTVYVPEHEIVVDSDSGFGSKSPATSFIGYNVKFSGRSKINVSVDATAAGLPPIEPNIDSGARLVR